MNVSNWPAFSRDLCKKGDDYVENLGCHCWCLAMSSFRGILRSDDFGMALINSTFRTFLYGATCWKYRRNLLQADPMVPIILRLWKQPPLLDFWNRISLSTTDMCSEVAFANRWPLYPWPHYLGSQSDYRQLITLLDLSYRSNSTKKSLVFCYCANKYNTIFKRYCKQCLTILLSKLISSLSLKSVPSLFTTNASGSSPASSSG